MSDSRPPTATPDLFPATPLPIRSLSRPPGAPRDSQHRFTQPFSSIPVSTPDASSSHSFYLSSALEAGPSQLPRPIRRAESPPSEPMAKRLRRPPSELHGKATRRSTSSSDSQDDAVDHGPIIKSETLESDTRIPSPPAPKKKRTRTLTTPHQSSVLQALLAKSRFPSTSVREEVGRSIGLSARKVQIWFQNQRQKARRPRTQGSLSPPQIDNVPHGSPIDETFASEIPLSLSVSGRQAQRFPDRIPELTLRAHLPITSVNAGASDSGACLLGPGIPAFDPETSAHTPDECLPPGRTRVSTPTSERLNAMFSLRPSERIHRRRSPTFGRPATLQPVSFLERDSSRTLPPLPPQHRSTPDPHRHRTSHPNIMTLPPYVPQRSLSPDARITHTLPDLSTIHLSRIIPPPFTLQPQPQWDKTVPTITPSPNTSAWSRPGSRAGAHVLASTTPHHRLTRVGPCDVPQIFERTSQVTLALPLASRSGRSGRYDPVRGTVMPFLTTSIPSPKTPPSHRPGNQSEDK